MTRSLSFSVFGEAVTQGNKRAFPVYRGKGSEREFTGKTVITEKGGARLAEWRNAIVLAARAAMNGADPIEGPVGISLMFYVKQPKRPKYVLPAVRPDWEKLSRAVCDALTAAGVYRDDGQIVTAAVCKRYAMDTPRVEVIVEEVEG